MYRRPVTQKSLCCHICQCPGAQGSCQNSKPEKASSSNGLVNLSVQVWDARELREDGEEGSIRLEETSFAGNFHPNQVSDFIKAV